MRFNFLITHYVLPLFTVTRGRLSGLIRDEMSLGFFLQAVSLNIYCPYIYGKGDKIMHKGFILHNMNNELDTVLQNFSASDLSSF